MNITASPGHWFFCPALYLPKKYLLMDNSCKEMLNGSHTLTHTLKPWKYLTEKGWHVTYMFSVYNMHTDAHTVIWLVNLLLLRAIRNQYWLSCSCPSSVYTNRHVCMYIHTHYRNFHQGFALKELKWNWKYLYLQIVCLKEAITKQVKFHNRN